MCIPSSSSSQQNINMMTRIHTAEHIKAVTLVYFPFSFSIRLKQKQEMCGFIYLNLQKVVELLTRGRKGFRSAELKVPQLILCSERNETTGTGKRSTIERKHRVCFSHIKILKHVQSASLFLFCLQSLIRSAGEKEPSL